MRCSLRESGCTSLKTGLDSIVTAHCQQSVPDKPRNLYAGGRKLTTITRGKAVEGDTSRLKADLSLPVTYMLPRE